MDKVIALIGRPNSGKTTIFNHLTGHNQRIGNWSGVTVEKKEGWLISNEKKYKIIDLPGCISLIASDYMPIDEKITCGFILKNKIDCVINVIDTFHLRRDLYITLQLLELLKVNIIVILNCMDKVKYFESSINVYSLSKELHCDIVPLISKSGFGMKKLRRKISTLDFSIRDKRIEYYSKDINDEIDNYYKNIELFNGFNYKGLALHALEGNDLLISYFKNIDINFDYLRESIEKKKNTRLDSFISQLRHKEVDRILETSVKKNINKYNGLRLTWLIDKVALNRFIGIPAFLLIMYLMFIFTINIGGLFQTFFDLASRAIFIEGSRELLCFFSAPKVLIAIISDGIGLGINITCSFIPVLICMFGLLSFLEVSGYISRVVFIIDKLMRIIGLPGKSFVPMVIGFGCNVPAILSTKTLDSYRDRILTIMIMPFISCSARLAIYTVFVSTFFNDWGGTIIFLLYLIGIIVSIVTGFVIDNVLLRKEKSSSVIELSSYQIPSCCVLFKMTKDRLIKFLVKAGKFIIPMCMIVGSLGALKTDGASLSTLENYSKKIIVIFKPIGIDSDNWPAAASLVSGIIAKEIIIGSLNALYLQDVNKSSYKNHIGSTDLFIEAIDSVKVNFILLKDTILRNGNFDDSVYRVFDKKSTVIMVDKFKTPFAAFAYLLFVLLYSPCIPVISVISKELNKKWAVISIFWCTCIAYFISTTFYQLITFLNHPLYSFLCIAGSFSLLLLFSLCIKKIVNDKMSNRNLNKILIHIVYDKK